MVKIKVLSRFNNLNNWLKGVILGTLLGIFSAGLTFFVLSAPKVLYYLILFVFGPSLRITGLIIRHIKNEIICTISFFGLIILYYSLIGLVLGTISQLPFRKKRKKAIIIIVIGLLAIIHVAAAIYEHSQLMRMPIF